MKTKSTRLLLLGALCAAVLPGPGAFPTAVAQEQSGESGGNLSGIKLEGDKPLLIESDKLEVRDHERTAIFSGNVSVVQGDTLLRSKTLTVRYSESGGSATTGSADIEHIEADGKVYVKSKAQVATGDRGTYDMKTETLVLTGKNVVLTEGESSAVGCKLTIHAPSGLAQLESCQERVKILIVPKSSE
jgi:lipopolysaccharide export system protein LptA